MSRLIRNKKLIGATSNDSSHIIYSPSDTSRSETTVKSELDRLNAGIPAVDVGTAVTSWTDTASATSAAQGASNYETLNSMTPSSTIKSLLGSIKSLLFGLSTQVTSVNTDLSDATNWTDISNSVELNPTLSYARAKVFHRRHELYIDLTIAPTNIVNGVVVLNLKNYHYIGDGVLDSGACTSGQAVPAANNNYAVYATGADNNQIAIAKTSPTADYISFSITIPCNI